MSLAKKQETGIGSDSKRVLPQPEMADELTLHRVLRSIAPQWAHIHQVCSKSTATAPKALMGAVFKGYAALETMIYTKGERTCSKRILTGSRYARGPLQDSATRAHSSKRLHLVIWVGKNEAHAVILRKRGLR